MKRKILINERTILRRIFEARQEGDGTWRSETNDELNNLIKKIIKLDTFRFKD